MSILVLDDEKNITLVLKSMLAQAGLEAVTCNDPEEASEILLRRDIRVVLSDLYMPGMDGMEILKFARSHRPQTPVVLMTAYGSIQSAKEAMRLGAFDYVTKPFDQEELLGVLRKALGSNEEDLKEEAWTWAKDRRRLLGASEPIRKVLNLVDRVAPSPSSVLIAGEPGSGKDLLAHEIHDRSDRRSKPFIKLNCASVAPDRLEAELFGREGDSHRRPGKLELARGGTLYIDEVGELPLALQARFLQALQEKEFERVDGFEVLPLEVRLVVSTSKDLEAMVQKGEFRSDLFYQLDVVTLQLPPLRDRLQDLPFLTKSFLDQISLRLGKPGLVLEEVSTFDLHGI